MRIDIVCKPDNPQGCKNTVQNVRQALSKLGVEAEVHQFADKRKMIDNRIYVEPALMIGRSAAHCRPCPPMLKRLSTSSSSGPATCAMSPKSPESTSPGMVRAEFVHIR